MNDWRGALPAEIVTPMDLMATIEALVAEARSHGLVPQLIGNCLRAQAPDEITE